MHTYTTQRNVIDEYVAPALSHAPGDYDLAAIAAEISTYYPGDEREDGRRDANTAGFHVTASDDEFWQAVARNER